MQNILKKKKGIIAISTIVLVLIFSVLMYQSAFAEVKVTIDEETQDIKTADKTVGELIDNEKIKLKDTDYINFDNDQELEDDMEVVIKTAKPVTVEVGNKTIKKETYKEEVKDILKDFDVKVDKDDKVSPALTAKYSDKPIKVTKVEKKEVVEEKELEFTTIYKDNKKLELGKTNTAKEGSKGLKEIKKAQVFENGKLVKEDIVSEKVVKEPVNQIIEKGKKPLEVASRGSKVEKKKEPAKKAEVKEEAKPQEKKEVAKAKPAPKKKEAPKKTVKKEAPKKTETKPAPKKENNKFNAKRTINMTSTAYCLKGTTASGLQSGPGRVAVDPNVIPLGTKLYIETEGWEDYGYAVAADTGSAIKGNIIDVFYSSRSTALKYGRRNIKVHILD